MLIDHLGVAVADIEKALETYADLFGYKLLRGPYDDPTQQARVAFIGSGQEGDVVLELIAPLGDDSHVARTLAKGVSAYHVCYEVEDIEKTLEEFRGKGSIIVSNPVPAVAYDGRRIAWVLTPTRQLTEFVERSAPMDR